jgi:hypothetical protein
MSELSAPFTDMAARLELNAEQGFGGAFVIVPPVAEGADLRVKWNLMLDNADSPAMFWSTLQTVCTIALQEIAREEEQLGGFMGGRR